MYMMTSGMCRLNCPSTAIWIAWAQPLRPPFCQVALAAATRAISHVRVGAAVGAGAGAPGWVTRWMNRCAALRARHSIRDVARLCSKAEASKIKQVENLGRPPGWTLNRLGKFQTQDPSRPTPGNDAEPLASRQLLSALEQMLLECQERAIA
jgi:hypothetical protein